VLSALKAYPSFAKHSLPNILKLSMVMQKTKEDVFYSTL